MKHTLQLNTTLITSLGHVLGKTNAELMEATGVSNATWYRIMGHPDEITVQQLISIANGLCIPVFRFFSIDGVNVIGNKEDYIENPYKPCYYDAEALQALVNTRSAATWQDVANSLGITRTNLRNSLLSYTRLPLARFLATCNAFDIEPFLVIVDPNTHRESNGQRSDMLVPFITSQNDAPLPENFIEMRIEMAKLRKQLFDIKQENSILRRNQNPNNMIKNIIKSPVTFFSGIRFLYDTKGLIEPLYSWCQKLVTKSPYDTFFYAKTGDEYNSVKFYTEDGIMFYEAGCESDLANHLFREEIMAGKIKASFVKDNDDVIELRADLVANASETRKDTADFAKFRKEMIQKFG